MNEGPRWLCLRTFQKLSMFFYRLLSTNFKLVTQVIHTISGKWQQKYGSSFLDDSKFSLLFRFKHILKPIANACIREEQEDYVDFEPYYTHIVCHECCHGIGPHSITLPTGKRSTVRMVRNFVYS